MAARRFLSVLLLSFFSLQAVAQGAGGPLERSNALAQTAIAHIQKGERLKAVIAAMQGLPADPAPTDFETYKAAGDALFRAMAARSFKSDRAGNQYYAVNRTGDRAVIVGLNSPTNRIEDFAPHSVVDTLHGRVIADIAPAAIAHSLVYGPGLPPALSPDGTRLAIYAMETGEVLQFALQNGAALTRLRDLAGRSGSSGHVIGYSPDGRRIAAQRGQTAMVWDVATSQVVETWEAGEASVAGWSHDGALIASRSIYDASYEVVALDLERWSGGTATPLARIEGRGANPWVYPSEFGPQILIEFGEAVGVYDMSARTYVSVGRQGDSFYRDVQAVGVLQTSGWGLGLLGAGRSTLRIMNLDGAPLEPEVLDWVPFDQHPLASDGTNLGNSAVRPYTYRGADVPRGRALFDAVRALLPPQALAEIDAGRVVR